MQHNGLQSVVLLLSCFLGLTQGQNAAAGFLKSGDAAMARGELTAALQFYSQAVEADSGGSLCYTKRAAAARAAGKVKDALRDLQTAVELDPSSTSPRLQRGRLLRAVCRFSDAESDFRAVLDLRPSHKAATSELQKVEEGREALAAAQTCGNAGEARAALRRVFEAAPDCGEARLIEAGLMLEEADYGGVVALTGQILKIDVGSVEALLLRGQAYYLLGDLDPAKRHFSEALRHDPDNRGAQSRFRSVKRLLKLQSQAETASASKRWQEAEEKLQEALGLDPAARIINTALWLLLCKARLQLKDPEAAIAACNEAVDHAPDDEEAITSKVRGLLMAGEYGAAHREASQARQRFNGSRKVLELLMEVEKRQKMAERKDWYAILGLPQDVHESQVKKAYRDLARRFHPDKAETEGLSPEEAQSKFTDIAAAYEVLSDPERRAAYDRGDDVEVQQRGGFPGQGFPGGFPGGGQQQFHFQWG